MPGSKKEKGKKENKKRLFLLHRSEPLRARARARARKQRFFKLSSPFSPLYTAGQVALGRLFGEKKKPRKKLCIKARNKNGKNGTALPRREQDSHVSRGRTYVVQRAPVILWAACIFTMHDIAGNAPLSMYVAGDVPVAAAELTLRNLCAVWGHLTFVSLTLSGVPDDDISLETQDARVSLM